jgi:hypothetical protein
MNVVFSAARRCWMANFDIDADPTAGVAIIATTLRLTPGCLSPSLIDGYVEDLKADLEVAAKRAKVAILSMKDLLDFPEGLN